MVRLRVSAILFALGVVVSLGGVPAGAETGALSYERCLEHATLLPRPASQLASELPEGFTPLTLDPAGTTGAVVLAAWTCGSGGTQVREAIEGVLVVPPDAYAVEGAQHFLVRQGFTSSSDSAARYASWCFGEVFKAADVSQTETLTPALRTGHVTATGPHGSLDFRTTIPGTRDGSMITPGLIRLFTSEGGAVRLMDINYTQAANFVPGTGMASSGGSPLGPGLAIHVEPRDGTDDNSFAITAPQSCG
ncbi:MAG TPA: hypothetical protein VM840_04345 [Actinomycetota bacterium]|nr:hypothetical protein [Actinomycetota bacterium]